MCLAKYHPRGRFDAAGWWWCRFQGLVLGAKSTGPGLTLFKASRRSAANLDWVGLGPGGCRLSDAMALLPCPAMPRREMHALHKIGGWLVMADWGGPSRRRNGKTANGDGWTWPCECRAASYPQGCGYLIPGSQAQPCSGKEWAQVGTQGLRGACAGGAGAH